MCKPAGQQQQGPGDRRQGTWRAGGLDPDESGRARSSVNRPGSTPGPLARGIGKLRGSLMSGLSYSQHWSDTRAASVLGTGAALPGEPVATEEILARLELRFGVHVRRQGRGIAGRLGVNTRY